MIEARLYPIIGEPMHTFISAFMPSIFLPDVPEITFGMPSDEDYTHTNIKSRRFDYVGMIGKDIYAYTETK